MLGAVLTGGMSTRMGSDKADILVSGRSMLDRVGHVMRSVSDQVILLGPDRPGWECWPDSVHARGPLAGIATALNRTHRSHVLLLAVDQPFVRLDTLERIVGLADEIPVVPVDDQGVPQVTCALYPRAIAGESVDEAVAGGSVQSLLDRVSFRPVAREEWSSWGEDGRSWYSVDDPSALEEGVLRFETG